MQTKLLSLLILAVLICPVAAVTPVTRAADINIITIIETDGDIDMWVDGLPFMGTIQTLNGVLHQSNGRINALSSALNQLNQEVGAVKNDVYIMRSLIRETIRLNDIQHDLLNAHEEAVTYLTGQIKLLEDKRASLVEANGDEINAKIDDAIMKLQDNIADHEQKIKELNQEAYNTKLRILSWYDRLFAPQAGYYDVNRDFHTFNERTLYYPFVFKATSCGSDLGECVVSTGGTLTITGVQYDMYVINGELSVYIYNPYTGEERSEDTGIDVTITKNGYVFIITVNMPDSYSYYGEHWIRIAKNSGWPAFTDSITVPFTVVP